MNPILKERLYRLLCIKSLITFMLTLIFGHMTATGAIEGQQFLTIFSVVIAFYFGSETNQPRTKGDS